MAYTSIANAITRHQYLLVGQLAMMVVLAVCGIGVWAITWFFPNFFVYPYFYWGGWGAVLNFWPLFACGIGLNLVVMFLLRDDSPIHISQNRELFFWEIATDTMAGLWEELGYRFIFVCYAMIIIGVANWIFSVGAGWIVTIVCGIVSLILWHQRERVFSILALAGAALGLLLAFYADPVYWIHQVIVYIVHFTTFFQMDPVLYGGYEKLFVFGAILANAWFRDGHKYQGLLGIVNAWYVGMVLLYATVTYGLLTAIVVHALYDMLISLLRFTTQKTKN